MASNDSASTEMIDLCDAAGNPTGRSAPRSEVHRLGLWHRTVHCWIATPANEVLLQKRSLAKESHPGLWDVSAAGHITAGDTSIGGAIREVYEELGLAVDRTAVQKLFEIKQCFEDPGKEYFDHEVTDVYLIRMAIDLGSLKLDSSEVEQVRLITVWEFKRELEEHPERFAPHGEEYGMVMSEINKQ